MQIFSSLKGYLTSHSAFVSANLFQIVKMAEKRRILIELHGGANHALFFLANIAALTVHPGSNGQVLKGTLQDLSHPTAISVPLYTQCRRLSHGNTAEKAMDAVVIPWTPFQLFLSLLLAIYNT